MFRGIGSIFGAKHKRVSAIHPSGVRKIAKQNLNTKNIKFSDGKVNSFAECLKRGPVLNTGSLDPNKEDREENRDKRERE